MRRLHAHPALLALLLGPLAAGCGFDQILIISNDDEEDTAAEVDDPGGGDTAEPSGEDTAGPDGDDTGVDLDDTGRPGDDTGRPADDTGGQPTGPRPPGADEIVISELMINPSAVDDSLGEWVEVWNATGEVLSLEGCSLGDRDVDDAPLTAASPGSLELAPGAFAVLCAHGVRAENGGAGCDATYDYNSWGDGFALANGGDEVQLRAPSGQVIDEVTYEDSPTGASSGLSPSAMDASQNDSAGRWCEQRSGLSGGDAGTPGAENDPC